MTTRRIFLRNSALAMVGRGHRAAVAASARSTRQDAPSPRKKILVAIFQRGAADGLNVVVPHGEKAYYDLRPTIAVPRPAAATTRMPRIDLDGFFGLHPSLAPLKPLFDQRHLAIVDAAGSPDPTRSHFDAQDYMESGTPGLKATDDGWMNRALPAAEGKPSPVRAVALGPTLPRSLRGPNAGHRAQSIGGFQVRDAAAARQFEADVRRLERPDAARRRPRDLRSRRACCNPSRSSPTRPPPAPNIRAAASATACGRSRS